MQFKRCTGPAANAPSFCRIALAKSPTLDATSRAAHKLDVGCAPFVNNKGDTPRS
jgi:hypothetical protein